MERCCNGVALTGLKDSRWPCWVFFFRLMLTSWEWKNSIDLIPVVPHKAVAEVSRIGNYRRDWLL